MEMETKTWTSPPYGDNGEQVICDQDQHQIQHQHQQASVYQREGMETLKPGMALWTGSVTNSLLVTLARSSCSPQGSKRD